VCGCAGGVARPAAANAIHYDKRPDHLVTVFAGQDREATEQARTYFEGYPPSSPSMAMLKDGKIITMLERHDIDRKSTRLNSSHVSISYAVFCLKKKTQNEGSCY